MEDTAQLYDMITKLSERVLELELQLSVSQIQLKEHVHVIRMIEQDGQSVMVCGLPVLLREQQEPLPEVPPDYHEDGLD